MKKSLFLLSAFTMMLFASCQPEELGTVVSPNDPPEMALKKTTFSVDNAAGTLTVPVDANYKSFTVTIDKAATWLTFKETKADTKAETKTYSLVFAYTANPVATARSGKATIKLAALSEEIVVNQAAAIPTMSLGQTERRVNPRGETFALKVTTNDEYTVTPSANWLSFDQTKGEVTVALNGTGEVREGNIVFASKADPKVKATLTLTQKAANVDPELINILAIGDAYTQDALLNLYPILNALGYTKIRIAELVPAATELAEQATAIAGTEKMSFVETTDGTTMVSKDTLATDVLAADIWDVIVLQQNFAVGGDTNTGSLGDLIKTVRQGCEFTPIFWNMTWAYKGTSTAAGFKAYGSNQLDMYEAIVNFAKEVEKNADIAGIIPLGTLIQNLRTSYLEDNLTSDDAHLSVNIGRLAASYLWAQTLTGKSVANVTYAVPNLRYEADVLPALKEAFANTLAKPYEVTEATQYAPYHLAIDEAAAKTLIEAAGYNFNDYVQAPFTIIHNAFYNSNNSATAADYLTQSMTSGAKDGNMDVFAATHILPKKEIPTGSLIVVLSGYQYRPEGWVTLTTKNNGTSPNPARPGNVTTPVVVVNDAWWGTFTYRAFNIAKSGGGALSVADMKKLDNVFGIFIPKTAISGTGLEDYNNGDWNW